MYMPNFFKKLTLKMPEEDDLFEEKSDESDRGREGIVSEETQEPTIEEESGEDEEQDELGGEQDESDEEEESDTILSEDDDEEEEGEGEQGDADEEVALSQEPQAEMNEGEKPFTIAQLARAKTEKKVRPKRFGVLRAKEEEEGDGGEGASGVPEGQLAIDVYETDSEIVLKSTIAGVKPEDLDIGIEDSTVNIRGSRHQEDKVKGDNYFYQECYWGAFSRSVILPVEVDSEKIKASLKDGILTIRLPKIIREKEKKIKVLAD